MENKSCETCDYYEPGIVGNCTLHYPKFINCPKENFRYWQPKTAPGKEWVNGVYESGGTSPIVLEEMPQITLINTRGN